MIHWEAITHSARTSVQNIQTELKLSETSETLHPVLRPQCEEDTGKTGASPVQGPQAGQAGALTM